MESSEEEKEESSSSNGEGKKESSSSEEEEFDAGKIERTASISMMSSDEEEDAKQPSGLTDDDVNARLDEGIRWGKETLAEYDLMQDGKTKGSKRTRDESKVSQVAGMLSMASLKSPEHAYAAMPNAIRECFMSIQDEQQRSKQLNAYLNEKMKLLSEEQRSIVMANCEADRPGALFELLKKRGLM